MRAQVRHGDLHRALAPRRRARALRGQPGAEVPRRVRPGSHEVDARHHHGVLPQGVRCVFYYVWSNSEFGRSFCLTL